MSTPWDRFGAPPEPDELPYKPPSLPAPLPQRRDDVTWPTEPAQAVPDVDDGKALVRADARSRSKRTLIQGLLVDLFAALIAAVATLSGLDPFAKETWIAFGVLVAKSFVSAAISYVMRMRSTPTVRLPGEKMAVWPATAPI